MTRQNLPIKILKSAIPLKSIIEEIVELKNGKGLCPFHDDRNPSFSVRGEKWRCFSCGEHGDVIDFVKKYNHIDTGGAIKMLASKAGIVTGPLTLSERASMARARAERQRRAALLKKYRQWENEHGRETALVLRTLRQVKARWTDFSTSGLERLAAVQVEIDYAEYLCTDVFCGKDEGERLSLYIGEIENEYSAT